MSEKAIAEKSKIVNDLKERISRSNVVVISDYLGFTVKDITDLRRKLRPEGAEVKVIRNTLIERAVAEVGFDGLKGSLKGATAVILGYKDAVSPLKVLVKFFKDAEKGAIRAGAVDKKVYNQDELNAISKLPSREVLLSKMVGGMQAPLYGIVNVLQGPLRKLVYALNSIKDLPDRQAGKKGGD